jgi:hypothetical protein
MGKGGLGICLMRSEWFRGMTMMGSEIAELGGSDAKCVKYSRGHARWDFTLLFQTMDSFDWQIIAHAGDTLISHGEDSPKLA